MPQRPMPFLALPAAEALRESDVGAPGPMLGPSASSISEDTIILAFLFIPAPPPTRRQPGLWNASGRTQ
jgi:hypothetical protein